MQRRIRLLALGVLGIVASVAGPAIAADRFSADPFATERDQLADPSGTQRHIHYYSRSGKTGESAVLADEVKQSANAAKSAGSISRLESARPRNDGPRRYRRLRREATPRTAAVKAIPGIRNYNDELFGNSDGRNSHDDGASRYEAVAKDLREQQESRLRRTAHRVPAREDSNRLPPADLENHEELGQRIINAEYQDNERSESGDDIRPVAGTQHLPPFGSETFGSRREHSEEQIIRQRVVPESVMPQPAVPESAEREFHDIAISRTATPQRAIVSDHSGPQTPAVTIEWLSHSNINVGQECECELVVRNSGGVAATDVIVEATFPSHVRLTDAMPRPNESRERLVWKFASLAPEETQRIRIKMIPVQRGELSTEAQVRFTGATVGRFTVEEPMLKLAVAGPKEVRVGDPASQTITVSNPGTGTAEGVTIEALIPAGLEHPRGERLSMEVGPLAPGESRQVRLALAAVGGGEQVVRVAAQTSTNLRQVTQASVQVIAPELEVAVHGPGLRYLGRAARYELLVKNTGTVSSNNVRVVHRVPKGFEFLAAEQGGRFETGDRAIHWFVGQMQPGESVKLVAQLDSKELGKFEHMVVASSENGSRAQAKLATRVEGTAALVLKVVDLDDPVEVGPETAYEVRVHNEGSKAASNVGLSCELPPGVEFVRAEGPADSTTESGLIVFKSLRTLDPGQTMTYRVIVRGATAGNHRFRARLTSDSIQEPLNFEELTRFYSE